MTLDAVTVPVDRNDSDAFINVERSSLDVFKGHFRAMLEEYAGFFHTRFNSFEQHFGDKTWTKEQFKHQLGMFLDGRGWLYEENKDRHYELDPVEEEHEDLEMNPVEDPVHAVVLSSDSDSDNGGFLIPRKKDNAKRRVYELND